MTRQYQNKSEPLPLESRPQRVAKKKSLNDHNVNDANDVKGEEDIDYNT